MSPLEALLPVQDSIGLKPRFRFTKDNIQHEGYTVVNKRGGFFGGFNGPGWLGWREGWVTFPCIDPFSDPGSRQLHHHYGTTLICTGRAWFLPA